MLPQGPNDKQRVVSAAASDPVGQRPLIGQRPLVTLLIDIENDAKTAAVDLTVAILWQGVAKFGAVVHDDVARR